MFVVSCHSFPGCFNKLRWWFSFRFYPTFATPWTVALQAPLSMTRILEWVAVSFGGSLLDLGIQPQVSCTAGRFFTDWAMREALQQTIRIQLIFVLRLIPSAPIALHCSFLTSSLVSISLSFGQEKPMNSFKHLPGTVHGDSVTQVPPEVLTPQHLLPGHLIRYQELNRNSF